MTSKILIDATAFDNAREPLAQAFKPVGGAADSTFLVIVNHFKSKGSGSRPPDDDQGDGQGASNHARDAAGAGAGRLRRRRSRRAGTDKVFLTGDFNAYTEEDPVKIIEDAGYVNVPRKLTDKETYQFDGRVGSLDHVFASTRGVRQGDRRRHLEHQRVRVGGPRVQPPQLQRHRLLPAGP